MISPRETRLERAVADAVWLLNNGASTFQALAVLNSVLQPKTLTVPAMTREVTEAL